MNMSQPNLGTRRKGRSHGMAGNETRPGVRLTTRTVGEAAAWLLVEKPRAIVPRSVLFQWYGIEISKGCMEYAIVRRGPGPGVTAEAGAGVGTGDGKEVGEGLIGAEVGVESSERRRGDESANARGRDCGRERAKEQGKERQIKSDIGGTGGRAVPTHRADADMLTERKLTPNRLVRFRCRSPRQSTRRRQSNDNFEKLRFKMQHLKPERNLPSEGLQAGSDQRCL
ncbi:unnamed protein product [Ectocarpus sp. 12 AP-2014]